MTPNVVLFDQFYSQGVLLFFPLFNSLILASPHGGPILLCYPARLWIEGCGGDHMSLPSRPEWMVDGI